ncbi:hypothetical protein [Pontiella agarivorans]|uniref:Lipoprotein n=1 Tax=Pontiella agarivorans TaxID=3038953 RepID=A0ABU5N1H9_9BACT|nr:hypothetical protein [Pontiella agarivorans]MDZ8120306.1 hypothetical protein [Pontiella agarivorans]
MSATDKTLLSICILSLVAGLLQHGCSKRIDKKDAALAQKSASGTFSAPAQNETNPNGTSIPTFVHIVNDEPAESMPENEHDRRMNAIHKHIDNLENQEPIKLPDDFDLFTAREGLKDMLFSPTFDSGTNTMTDAEKWEFIEAGNLPW